VYAGKVNLNHLDDVPVAREGGNCVEKRCWVTCAEITVVNGVEHETVESIKATLTDRVERTIVSLMIIIYPPFGEI
jgi:hypothetical protein